MSTRPDLDLMDLDVFVAGREHELFATLRAEDPLHWNEEPDGPGFWSFTRDADIRWAGQRNDVFSNEGGTQIQSRRAEGDGEARSMINMDDPRHKQVRQILVDHFTRRGAEIHLAERARTVVDGLLDAALEQGDCDWVETVSVPLPLHIFGTWLGVPVEDLGRVADWVNVIGGQEDPEYTPSPEVMASARESLFAYFSELNEERTRAPQDDLVSILAHARVDGEPLDVATRLLPNHMLLAFAGNDTTRNVVSWSVPTFDAFPGEWDALCADVDGRVGTTVEELVRYATPVYCMRRTMKEGFERHGQRVEEGDKVVLWWASGCRDPEAIPDPDRFDGARTPNKHLAFGWGRHFCLGSHVARLEVEILLRRMIERGIRVEMRGEPDRLRSNFFRGIKRLPVRVTVA